MSATGNAESVVHVPKCDRWFSVLIWVVIAVTIGYGVNVAWAHGSIPGRLLQELLLVLFVSYCLGVLYMTSYTLIGADLSIGFRGLRVRVPLDTIESIAPARVFDFGWEWYMSADRLFIRRRKKLMGVIISPENPEAFLAEVASRSDNLEVQDGRIIRRSA